MYVPTRLTPPMFHRVLGGLCILGYATVTAIFTYYNSNKSVTNTADPCTSSYVNLGHMGYAAYIIAYLLIIMSAVDTIWPGLLDKFQPGKLFTGVIVQASEVMAVVLFFLAATKELHATDSNCATSYIAMLYAFSICSAWFASLSRGGLFGLTRSLVSETNEVYTGTFNTKPQKIRKVQNKWNELTK